MASIQSNSEGPKDSLTFIGTATVFLEIDGVKLIVDPAFYHGSKSVNMGWGLRSKRLLPPAINIDDLDTPDLLLLTHTHNDHWDDEAKAGISNEIIVVTNHSAASKLRKDGFTNVTGLKDEEYFEHDGLKIIAVPAQHGPRFMNPFTGSVIGFIIESSQGRLWISGDTIETKKLKTSLQNYHPTVGIVNFGGVRYILPRLTFTPSSAKKTMEGTLVQTCFPVHVDDWTHFRTSKEDIEEEFRNSQIKIIFPPRGQQINLWQS